ncbi:hypothetical protein GGR51DRAFT_555107 [Nemania sp. FL0031]|nr:hypothetical protein GGR51DRAFT_555107 [Nemania sp. FL0031]
MESDNESSDSWAFVNPPCVSSEGSSSIWTSVDPGPGSDFIFHDIKGDAPSELERAYAQETEELGITLQTLLSTFLDLPDAGTPSVLPESRLEFEFGSVAAHICRYTFFDESQLAMTNRFFTLKLPTALGHPLVYQAIRKHMITRHTQRFVMLQALERLPNEKGVDYLLAWLCYELCASGSGPYCPIGLLSDLKSSFRSLNTEWRESMLWSLLKWLVSSRRITGCLIIISFYGSVDRYKNALPFIQDLIEYISSTETRFRLLILPPAGESVDVINAFDTIDLTSNRDFKAALKGDIAHWVETFFCGRSLRYLDHEIVRDQIQKQIDRHYQDPILLISYLRGLGHQNQLTYEQLKEYSNLLISAEHFTRSILDSIPYYRQQAVAIVLSMIHQAMRPLTLAEVLAALVNCSTELQLFGSADPIAFSNDVYRSLAGLVYEKDTYLYILHPSLKRVLDGVKSDSKLSPWLGMRIKPNSMARICLDHLFIWTESQKNRAIEKSDISADKWPLLRYAIKFWHRHMELEGLRVITDEYITLQLFWGTVKSWIRLWPYAHPWDRPSAESSTIAPPSPAWIAGSFGVPNPVQAVLLTWRTMQFMDGHEDAAAGWAVSQLTFPTEAEEIKRAVINNPRSWPVILKALPLDPLQIFRIFSEKEGFLKRNLKAILNTAINQGVVEIVDCCWPMVKSKEAIILDLPWIACARTGNTSIIQHLTKSWHLFEKTRNTLGPALLREAVESGHLEVAKLLLKSNFDLQSLGDSESSNVILLASRLGFKSVLSFLLEQRPNILLQNIHGYNALEEAVMRGYKGIVEILLAHGVPTAMGGQHSKALLNKVSSYHRTEIIDLLKRASRERNHG